MPDMDGFKLLEHVGLEMDLPVISKLLTISFYKTSPFLSFALLVEYIVNTCTDFWSAQ